MALIPSSAFLILSRYDAALVHWPLLTKCATSALTAATGDSTAQAIQRGTGETQSFDRKASVEVMPERSERPKHDIFRTLRMCTLATCGAVVGHLWYNMLDTKVPSKLPTFARASVKCVADQVSTKVCFNLCAH